LSSTDGLFEYKRLPFRPHTAFIRQIAELQKRVKKGDMMHYIDDADSQTFDEMYEKLENTLQVLRDGGLTLILEKCELLLLLFFFSHGSHARTSPPTDRGALPCVVRLDSRKDRRDIEKKNINAMYLKSRVMTDAELEKLRDDAATTVNDHISVF